MREIAWSFIKYKISDGTYTQLWTDHQHPHGPLLKTCGPRLLYDVNSNMTVKIEEELAFGQSFFQGLNCYQQ